MSDVFLLYQRRSSARVLGHAPARVPIGVPKRPLMTDSIQAKCHELGGSRPICRCA